MLRWDCVGNAAAADTADAKEVVDALSWALVLPGECESEPLTAITSIIALLLATFGTIAGFCNVGAKCASTSAAGVIVTDVLELCVVATAAECGASPQPIDVGICACNVGDAFKLYDGLPKLQPSAPLLAFKELCDALSICGRALINLCDSDCGCWRSAYCGCG